MSERMIHVSESKFREILHESLAESQLSKDFQTQYVEKCLLEKALELVLRQLDQAVQGMSITDDGEIWINIRGNSIYLGDKESRPDLYSYFVSKVRLN
jgi:hypothetical protein